jgi:hypothetical protein
MKDDSQKKWWLFVKPTTFWSMLELTRKIQIDHDPSPTFMHFKFPLREWKITSSLSYLYQI